MYFFTSDFLLCHLYDQINIKIEKVCSVLTYNHTNTFRSHSDLPMKHMESALQPAKTHVRCRTLSGSVPGCKPPAVDWLVGGRASANTAYRRIHCRPTTLHPAGDAAAVQGVVSARCVEDVAVMAATRPLCHQIGEFS